jgi:hypothetical protein
MLSTQRPLDPRLYRARPRRHRRCRPCPHAVLLLLTLLLLLGPVPHHCQRRCNQRCAPRLCGCKRRQQQQQQQQLEPCQAAVTTVTAPTTSWTTTMMMTMQLSTPRIVDDSFHQSFQGIGPGRVLVLLLLPLLPPAALWRNGICRHRSSLLRRQCRRRHHGRCALPPIHTRNRSDPVRRQPPPLPITARMRRQQRLPQRCPIRKQRTAD